ncbi:Cytochrome P450 [Mycena chlorophos]|uniref:Cytochrome P450 n=1 Tax=Mycena chlorophos TaxID=658473 RepID=A0A8H6RYE2_MYCCL|nr:Cytochrome P450 [Mycena chlorophos]
MLVSVLLTTLKTTLGLVGLTAGFVACRLSLAFLREWRSSARLLPGPPTKDWLSGSFGELRDNPDAEQGWIARWGRTMRLRSFLGLGIVYTLDTTALHHILTRTDIYQKSDGARFSLGRLVGPGILVVEGEQHRQQRRIMNPAFGAPQVRALTSIFVDKSLQLRDLWAAQTTETGSANVEALSWLSKATLDVIGLAGFNHDINSLGGAHDELAESFERIFGSGGEFSFIRLLQMLVPWFRRLPIDADTSVLDAQAKMKSIGRRLLAEAKREAVENRTFETGHGRDLLTLLVKANTSKDIPDSQRLSDEDVIAQVPTFLVAGHETTSTAPSFRAELLSVPTDTPTMDELNALPYLECFVREASRLYAPVLGTGRNAVKDDVVPLGTPITDTKGNVVDSIRYASSSPPTAACAASKSLILFSDDRVKKGQPFLVPIAALNKDTNIWGPDALEFKPERWETTQPPPSDLLATAIPGVWGHMLTFLGGPRGCIGFRFSLVETKALLFTLVRAFEFELAAGEGGEKLEISSRGNGIVERPIVKSEMEKGCQLPLLIRPVGSQKQV